MFIVYEPQVTGHEHVEFNSAFLTMLGHAFPGERVIFFAEKTHLDLVAARLADSLSPRRAFRFVAVQTPPRLAHPARRLLRELCAFPRLLRFSRRIKASGLIFSSMTAEGLFALKVSMRRRPTSGAPAVAVVFHAILEALTHRPRRHPLARLFGLRNALRFRPSSPVRYLLLAESFGDKLKEIAPELTDSLICLEHPYLFAPPALDLPRRLGHPVAFGTIGAAKLSKGFGDWETIARSVRGAVGTEAASFVHVGLVCDVQLYRARPLVRFVSDEGWTDRAQFERELHALDYAVFLYPRDSYVLTASGALMDALSFARPVLALRNPFFEHCFGLLGDIGYLCDSLTELSALMVTLVTHPPHERFWRQQATILEERRRLSPAEIASSFARKWRSAESVGSPPGPARPRDS